MRLLWTWRSIAAPASVAWEILVDTERWPTWGPSVRSASLDRGPLQLGSTGVISLVGGVALPFEVTEFVAGQRWRWHVARIPATDHVVEPVDDRHCRVGFGVPALAAPYLTVCRVALVRIAVLAAAESGS